MLALTSGNRKKIKLPYGIGEGVSNDSVIFETVEVKTKGTIGAAIESDPRTMLADVYWGPEATMRSLHDSVCSKGWNLIDIELANVRSVRGVAIAAR